jgi:beta-RFAP synthase
MIRVTTASRLHFGLLSVTPPPLDDTGRWPNHLGDRALPARAFGSVGLMVRAPGVRIAVTPAPVWCACGPLAERAMSFAEHYLQSVAPLEIPPQQMLIERAAPEHVGLGTGTQLALAVGRALAHAGGLSPVDAVELSRRVGRGLRSALGIHGFDRGGFLVDAGKRDGESLAPLLVHERFPDDWRIVLLLSAGGAGLHGNAERQAFDVLRRQAPPLGHTDALCRLVLLGLLPALVEHDLAAFGEALYDFNVRVGETFAPVQGGTYASQQVEQLIAWVRRQGVAGVGQSSWGPGVFAIVEDEARAHHLAAQLRRQFALPAAQVLVTAASNEGAVVVNERTASG